MSPYSMKVEAITRVAKLLEAMWEANGDITFHDEEPHKLAYKLHNAIAIASDFPEYKGFAGLASKFRIRVRPKKVVCELRTKPVIESVLSLPTQFSHDKVTLHDVDDAAGIVGAMIQGKHDEAHFPDAILDEGELKLLWAWTSVNNYHIINHEDGGVTVTKERSELAWHP